MRTLLGCVWDHGPSCSSAHISCQSTQIPETGPAIDCPFPFEGGCGPPLQRGRSSWQGALCKRACPQGQAFLTPMALSWVLCLPRGPRSLPPCGGRAAVSQTAQSMFGSSLWVLSPGRALQPSWSLTSSLFSAELLPHLGGLQLQGHEAAFPAEVRLLRVPQMERGWVEERTSHPQTVLLSISPGPLCWLLWPSWMPSRKWLTWPPTPEVGRGHGWRLGMPQVGLGSWKGWVEYEPGKGSQAQSRALEFCSLMKWAFCGESLSSLEACKQEWVKGDRNVTGGVPFSLLGGWLDPSATGVHLPNGESDCGFISPVPICCSGRTQGR